MVTVCHRGRATTLTIAALSTNKNNSHLPQQHGIPTSASPFSVLLLLKILVYQGHLKLERSFPIWKAFPLKLVTRYTLFSLSLPQWITNRTVPRFFHLINLTPRARSFFTSQRLKLEQQFESYFDNGFWCRSWCGWSIGQPRSTCWCNVMVCGFEPAICLV